MGEIRASPLGRAGPAPFSGAVANDKEDDDDDEDDDFGEEQGEEEREERG